MDAYQQPVALTWAGPPFGAYNTVGVGYREEGEKRFLILLETWTYELMYVDYDQNKENCVAMTRFYPAAQHGVPDPSIQPHRL